MDYKIIKYTHQNAKKYLQQIVEINNSVDKEYWKESHFMKQLPMKFELSHIVLLGCEVIGYIIASQKDKSTCHIHKTVIKQQFRGKGLGRLLMISVFDSCVENNLKLITISVYKSNIPMLKLNESLGYVKYGERQDTINNNKLYELCLKII